MIVATLTEFRTRLNKYLAEVENGQETLIVKRSAGKGIVMISLDEYNSIMETVHLMASRNNAERLFESIQQMEQGRGFEGELLHE